MIDLVGKVIGGRYQLEAFLGKGSMAEVYKAWDSERRVYLALKALHADLAEDRVFLRRFQREAQTLVTLQHPNIVRCYGLEQSDNLVYILMDYVEGKTLRKEIFEANAPLPWNRILQVTQPLCGALYYAHKRGFVHCDVKPANIMVHESGNILIADFGIARMTESATTTLLGAGTPAYMAPEQILEQPPTPQTDIYAVGVILFEMLTGGERPFTGENAKTPGSLSEKVRWEKLTLTPPPPSKYNPAIPPELDRIVLKCLDKSPANRYLSAVDLYAKLAALGGNAVVQKGEVRPAVHPPQKKNATAQKRTRIVIASLLAAFSVLAVAAVCLFAGFQIVENLLRAPTPSANTQPQISGYTVTLVPAPKMEPSATLSFTPEPTFTLTPTPTPTLSPTPTSTFTSTPRPPTPIPPSPTKKPKEKDGGGGDGGGGGPIIGGG